MQVAARRARPMPGMARLGGIAAATALTAALAVPAAAQDLTVVSWGGNYQDAQRKVIFEPFMEETGINIVEDEWNGGIGAVRSRVMAGEPTWHVLQVEAQELYLGCEEGMYEPIDWDAMSYSQDDFIPGAATECGVGTIVWSTQMAYDADRIEGEGPQSWADFWDTETFPGARGLRRGPQYSLEFALIADGVPPKEVYDLLSTEEGVDRAFAKLDEIKDDIVWWEAGAQPLQMLASGEVAMTSLYNGRLTGSNRTEGTNFKGVWPGSIYSIDSWVILSGAPNVDQAMEFIDYSVGPERQSQIPEFVAYGATNKAADEMIPEEYKDELPTTPANLEEAIELDTAFWVENIEALTERFDRWASQ